MTFSVQAETITVDNTRPGTVDTNSHYVTNKASLVVSGVTSGDSLSAYKILDTFYNDTTKIVSYEFTTDFKNFLSSSDTYSDLTVEQYTKYTGGSLTSGATNVQSELDALASAYAGYIKTHPSVTSTALSASGTTATLSSVDSGSYLVLPTSTSRVYAVMVGNLGLTAESGEWVSKDVDIVAKVNDASVSKTVGDKSTTEQTYNFGDEFTYYISGSVPRYPANATNKKYTVKDTMDAGLTFKGIASVDIKDGETTLTVASDGKVTDSAGNQVAVITVNGQSLEFDFNVDYVNSTTITISYKATLNENAVLGLAGNKNGASLVYSNDPYGTGTNELENPSETTVRTYGISVLKFETGKAGVTLAGAKFEVYSSSDLSADSLVGTITTGEDGTDTLLGVKAGTYYLKEVVAPVGYALKDDVVEVTVDDTNDEGDTGIVKISIDNSKVGSLPITGGMGTIIFTVSGAILMLGAIWF
ncbi:MAG: SpaH/EbpB family LPXTG-anchored major pilin, partial [Bacilli bacterium]|nr:SpaH/EbpB family LPXTG-anchored major pilin [Bacilli bacterium]